MFVFVYVFVYVYAFVYVYVYVSVIVYVFVHVFFFPNSEALGFQSLKGRLQGNSGPKTRKVSWGDSYDDSYGVSKLLEGKCSFLKPDDHYTTIFLAS